MSNAARLLVLEDELNVGLTLLERLEQEGFSVDWAKTIESARTLNQTNNYDLALLDVGLTDGSGFDFAAALSNEQPGCALIFLTAYGTPDDRIRGLEIGAADYVVKPFHFRELLLRIKNALRVREVKYGSGEAATIAIGEALFHVQKFQLEAQGRFFPLSTKECSILKLLYERRGAVVSRDEILDYAWSKDEFPSPRTVDNFVVRLRRMVEVNPEMPKIITSVRGVGYQLSQSVG